MVKDLNIPKLHQPESSLMLMLFSKKTKTEADSDWSKKSQLSNHTATKENNKPGILSPDGKKLAYIDNHNLWIEDTTTHDKKQLTT